MAPEQRVQPPHEAPDPAKARRHSDEIYDHWRAVRILNVIFAAAVTVSVVHYLDNSVNFEDFTEPPEAVPASPTIVVGVWVVLTIAGLGGYLLFRRSPSNLALILLAVYSGSGLVGIGHYLVPGATSMPWWRQAHVIADIACGIAMFSFALWAARVRPRGPLAKGRGSRSA